jgi:DnaJ-class molecular chaperone
VGDLLIEKLAPEKTICPYCTGKGVGEYWVHSLTRTIDAECHACDGAGALYNKFLVTEALRDLETC